MAAGGLRGTAFFHSPLLSAGARGRSVSALVHAVDILPTLVSAAAGAAALGALAPLQLDGMDAWRVIADPTVAAGPRTEALLEADPHSLPLQKECGADAPAPTPSLSPARIRLHPLAAPARYCGDQHGQGPGTPYYALRSGRWKLLLGDPAGGAGDGWCRHSAARQMS